MDVQPEGLCVQLGWHGRFLDGPLRRRVKSRESVWCLTGDDDSGRYSVLHVMMVGGCGPSPCVCVGGSREGDPGREGGRGQGGGGSGGGGLAFRTPLSWGWRSLTFRSVPVATVLSDVFCAPGRSPRMRATTGGACLRAARRRATWRCGGAQEVRPRGRGGTFALAAQPPCLTLRL